MNYSDAKSCHEIRLVNEIFFPGVAVLFVGERKRTALFFRIKKSVYGRVPYTYIVGIGWWIE